MYVCEHYPGSGSCTEGRVAVVSDADNSSLQLVEMCQNQTLWSPLCDSDWTQHNVTVICRELGYTNSGIVIIITKIYCVPLGEFKCAQIGLEPAYIDCIVAVHLRPLTLTSLYKQLHEVL